MGGFGTGIYTVWRGAKAEAVKYLLAHPDATTDQVVQALKDVWAEFRSKHPRGRVNAARRLIAKYGATNIKFAKGVVPKEAKQIVAPTTHDEMSELMAKLGSVLGYQAKKSARLSEISVSVPASMRDRTVDILWTGPATIPIEVQVQGNLDSLVRRLETAEPHSKKLIVVGDEEDLRRVREEVESQKPKSFVAKMVYLKQDDLQLLRGSVESLSWYRKKVGL